MQGSDRPFLGLIVPFPSIERIVVDTIGRNDTLSDIFARNEIAYAELAEVLGVTGRLFDLNHLQAGSLIKLVLDDEKRLTRLEYEIDDRRLLRVTSPSPDSMTAVVDEFAYRYRQRLIGGEITSSLYETIQDMQEDTEIAFLLSDIFAWQVDFSTDIRAGDHFKAVVEEYWGRDGIPKLNLILAAELANDGKFFQAFRYRDPGGKVDYYDGAGASVRRKFLRSPLNYTRISSRFSHRRLHPILRVYRPHLGVDYAAPSGTPVVTVGDGEVICAGRDRGLGNVVRVRHNGIYQTSYGHLSRFGKGVRKGARVEQGQIIGYVGSTGLSTGPHLDYRLFKNGKPVNPLAVDLPSADPVEGPYLDEFRNWARSCLEVLEREDQAELAQLLPNPRR